MGARSAACSIWWGFFLHNDREETNKSVRGSGVELVVRSYLGGGRMKETREELLSQIFELALRNDMDYFG